MTAKPNLWIQSYRFSLHAFGQTIGLEKVITDPFDSGVVYIQKGLSENSSTLSEKIESEFYSGKKSIEAEIVLYGHLDKGGGMGSKLFKFEFTGYETILPDLNSVIEDIARERVRLTGVKVISLTSL